MPIDENEYAKVVAAIEKKWKQKDMFRLATNMPAVNRVPTGSDEFDFITGDGVPIRRMTRFWGGESSGKSLMGWNVARHAQNIHIIMDERFTRLAELAEMKPVKKALLAKRDWYLKTYPDGMDVIYYNVEQTFDPEFVERAGVNLKKVRLVDDTVIETVGEALENMIIAGADLHIIDSTTSAIPLEELNMETTEHRRGLEAKRWSLMLRRAKQRFMDNSMGIYISQVRIDQKTNSEYAPGGKYLDHASDLSVHFRAGKWLYIDKKGVLRDKAESDEAKTRSGLKEPDGVEVQCRVGKSRVCRPFLTARMRLGYEGMKIDRAYELKEAALWYGIVKKSSTGGWYTLPNGEKVNGEAAIRDAIAADKDLEIQIREVWREHIPK
jgi:RecA/RadA recombinase